MSDLFGSCAAQGQECADSIGQRCRCGSTVEHDGPHRCWRCGAQFASDPPERAHRPLRFDGDDYVPARDDIRLTGQIERVFGLMRDGAWRTLQEIADTTGDPPASVSAQLRHLRKPRFGEYDVQKRHRGDPATGLYEYRIADAVAVEP